MNTFTQIINQLFIENSFIDIDIKKQFAVEPNDEDLILQKLNAAFILVLGSKEHPMYNKAMNFLKNLVQRSEWSAIAKFYLDGAKNISFEIDSKCKKNANFHSKLKHLAEWLCNTDKSNSLNKNVDRIWSVFYPEAVGMNKDPQRFITKLKKKRKINISQLNSDPIKHPASQILFAANVLLTVPPKSQNLKDLSIGKHIKDCLDRIGMESQLYWYDHPIQVGVDISKNEVIYGLRGLDSMVDFEQRKGTISKEDKIICILSASVTHKGLHQITKRYLKDEFAKAGGFKNINVYVFTEEDTNRIIGEVLVPAAKHYLKKRNSVQYLDKIGVDGEYGRHYTFLKAIAAFWNVLIDSQIQGTFKIDLDQVFPQEELIEETGFSALEHLKTPLWGATGITENGERVDLGMIAGALVNQRDIHKSVFTPDVPIPNRPLSPDEYIFFSGLPQAISTQAEMMTRYNSPELDGKEACIQRIHVTGGTTGILISHLFKYRPFTPSFIGRAEDQAYIMSSYRGSNKLLSYLHKPGLIMRHDKEVFANEAIKAAATGKLIGDYTRILYFSEYAKVLFKNLQKN